jgi:GT2 family glycosyltransferase
MIESPQSSDFSYSLVDVLILTYRPDLGLARCIGSVAAESASLRIIVAVNRDASAQAELDAAVAESTFADQIVTVFLGKNWGYAEGVNMALEWCERPYVLLLNDDAVVFPNAIRQLLDTLSEQSKDVVGVSPKTLFMDPGDLIDNVGASIRPSGWIYNRGVGEIDIGQYSITEPVGGLCFAAALLRRDAFGRDSVGPLESSYFMYGEDAEWCLRARLLGKTFLCDPRAVVSHAHSLSASDNVMTTKNWLIRRNTTLTVVALFPLSKAIRFVLVRVVEQIGSVCLGSKRQVALQRLFDLLKHLPCAMARRHRQRRRISQGSGLSRSVFGYTTEYPDCLSFTESGHPAPKPTRATLITMYEKRGHSTDAEVVQILKTAPTVELDRRLRPLLQEDGASVLELLEAISVNEMP